MNKFIRGVGILGVIAALVFVPGLALAQQAGQGLEISPPRLNLDADPGDTLKTEIRVRNVTDQTLVARPQYNDFVAGNEEDGNPRLLLDEDATEPSPYSIKDWIEEIPALTLEPNQQKTIKVTINVPNDASPGGHYGVIRFTGTPPEVDESAVSLSASIGTLALITVSGDIQEQASIEEIYTSQNNERRSVFEYGPVSTITRFKNDGNVHVQPSGTITVTDMFGRTVESFKFNESQGNVLPQSIRKFENVLNKKLLFGRYKVTADIVYGSNNTIVSGATTFWAVPYKLLALLTVALVALVIGIRRYNKYIVKRAQGRKDKQS